MEAYIDREAAVESLNAMKPFLRDRGQVQLLRRIMNHIGKIPVADVVPVVHGRWIKPTKIGHRAFDIPHCSACDGVPCGVDENTNYCPNCGARMDGE